MNREQAERMSNAVGFIAALDQSGGSTPKALKAYGIQESAFSNEEEMFDLVHQMRSRIIGSPSFTGDKVLAAILFEQTMDREVDGQLTGEYLWSRKQIVPFVKVDQGLTEETDGVQLMKEMTKLDSLLERGVQRGMFGTKMRSVINSANSEGIERNVAQQFEYAQRILDAGLMPIIEPEVNINAPDKAEAEEVLRNQLRMHLASVPDGKQVMFKLTIPSEPGFYTELMGHDKVMRIVALSGGYSREQANELLSRNPGLIASFSRALTEGLTAQHSDEEFDAQLGSAVDSIYQASAT